MGSSALTHEEVSLKIGDLQAEIKDMQSGRKSRKDYAKKLRELMYWRQRQIQLGKKSDEGGSDVGSDESV